MSRCHRWFLMFSHGFVHKWWYLGRFTSRPCEDKQRRPRWLIHRSLDEFVSLWRVGTTSSHDCLEAAIGISSPSWVVTMPSLTVHLKSWPLNCAKPVLELRTSPCNLSALPTSALALAGNNSGICSCLFKHQTWPGLQLKNIQGLTTGRSTDLIDGFCSFLQSLTSIHRKPLTTVYVGKLEYWPWRVTRPFGMGDLHWWVTNYITKRWWSHQVVHQDLPWPMITFHTNHYEPLLTINAETYHVVMVNYRSQLNITIFVYYGCRIEEDKHDSSTLILNELIIISHYSRISNLIKIISRIN